MEKKTEAGNGMNNKAQFIIIFLVGFLLGLLVGPTFTSDKLASDNVNDTDVVKEEESTTSEVKNGTEKPTTSAVGINTIAVDNQIAGDRVMLSKIVIEEEGWVVVHEVVDGVLTNALGASRLNPGVHNDGYVELLRNTESGSVYFVVLYSDNGDGEFKLADDHPLMNSKSELISTTFETIQLDRKN